MFSIGDSVRMGGITGKIVNWFFDEGDVWVVNLGGVICECSTREILNGYPPAEWEAACLANSYDAEMLAEWEKTQKILDERYPLSSGG